MPVIELDSRRLASRHASAPERVDAIVESSAMRQIFETARRVALGTLPVVLCGETGTGKEILARLIHDSGPRRAGPLLCLNCAAVAPSLLEAALFGFEKGAFTGADTQRKGVFEAADGGTVFLDEIAELTAPAQAALLRVLETKRFARVGSTKELHVDVRVISATHCDLEAMALAGRFRHDLLFRLNALILRIPPLRERIEEVPTLARHFLEQANRANATEIQAIDAAAMQALVSYSWPGNVRELRNAIDHAVLFAHGPTVGALDLPERVRDASAIKVRGNSPLRQAIAALQGDFRARLEHLEAEVLRHALEESGWNQTHAARKLRMPRRTLVHKIKTHGLLRPIDR